MRKGCAAQFQFALFNEKCLFIYILHKKGLSKFSKENDFRLRIRNRTAVSQMFYHRRVFHFNQNIMENSSKYKGQIEK